MAKKKAKKKKKKKKKKVVPKAKRLKRAKNAAHKQMSLYIRAKFEKKYGKCPLCNENPIQCVFHIQRSKYVSGMRYDARNVIGACHTCNWSEYRNPDPSRAWYVKEYGAKQYMHIVKEGARLGKVEYTIDHLERIAATYKRLIEVECL